MTSYHKFSDKELVVILSEYNKLSIVAKRELKKEFASRNILDQEKLLTELDKEISKENQDITNLKSIGNLGLIVENNDPNCFKISRSGQAMFLDILAIAIGIIFSILGLIGIANVLTFSSPILGVFLCLIGVSGPKILIKSINRFFEYFGFSFEVVDDLFYLKKRFDIRLENIEGNVASLYIDNSNDLMYNDISIIKVNALNSINKSTLKAILQKSQGKAA